MESIPREQIEAIATNIFDCSDIIAMHGTSVKNGLSILNAGFNFNKTSYVMLGNKSIKALCCYGWKENKPNDAVNVIIAVPREFLMNLLSMSNIEEYNNWIQNAINNDMQEGILNSLTSFEYHERKQSGRYFFPASFSAHIPEAFIVGMFVWCNGKTYLNLLVKEESALDNLNYIENKKFYLNLSSEERNEVVTQMREKLGIESKDKSRK